MEDNNRKMYELEFPGAQRYRSQARKAPRWWWRYKAMPMRDMRWIKAPRICLLLSIIGRWRRLIMMSLLTTGRAGP